MLGNYSKLVGSIVGGAFGFAVSKGLPEALATPDVQAAVVGMFGTLFMYFFPANKPSA